MHSSFFEGGERHTYRHQALGMGIRGPKWVYWENPWINSSFFVGYLCFKTNLNIQDFGHFWAALHMPLVDSPAAPIPIVSGRSGSPIVGVFLVSRINRPHYNGFPYIGCCSSLWTVVWPSPAKMDESSRTFWLWMVIDPLHPHEYPIRYFHEYPIRITMRSHKNHHEIPWHSVNVLEDSWPADLRRFRILDSAGWPNSMELALLWEIPLRLELCEESWSDLEISRDF